MNKKQLYLTLMVLHVFCIHITAQNVVDREDAKEKVLEIGLQNIALTKANHSLTENADQANTNNNIFITQIGANNLLNVKTSTRKSDIELVQNGKDNTIDIKAKALIVRENIHQLGDNNFFAEYVNTPNLNLERNIQQNGNSQNLVIHGNNSISEKIRLNMEGTAKTIVIRNFN